MFVDAIAKSLPDYSCFIVLLSLGLLGLSYSAVGSLFGGPRKANTQRREREGRALKSRAVDILSDERYCKQVPRLGSVRSGEREEVRMSTASVEDCDQRIRRQKGVKKEEAGATEEEEEGRLRRRESNLRPLWLRSLSQRQSKETKAHGAAAGEGEEEKGSVQRKASLTGEQVKELADAFIARVRNRLRLQRQQSYEARLDRSS